jgi:hypothetical protein
VFWDAARDVYHGLTARETDEAFAAADLFLNVGGVNRLGRRPRPRVCVYVDTDPTFTQLSLAGSAVLRELVAEHELHFTYGENIGTSRSPIPTGGFAWRPARPPVMPELWAAPPPDRGAPWTTIGKWSSEHRTVEFEGRRLGWSKSEQWPAFADLPRRTGERLELAMDVQSRPADHAQLTAAGWTFRDPLDVSIDADVYRDYLRGSKGEFTAAKEMNVVLRSGWFSDRSACYLAAGRPAVVQDTGFGDVLPTGCGLFAVGDAADAAAALAAVDSDLAQHSRAALELAERWFAPSATLGPILAAAGLVASPCTGGGRLTPPADSR